LRIQLPTCHRSIEVPQTRSCALYWSRRPVSLL